MNYILSHSNQIVENFIFRKLIKRKNGLDSRHCVVYINQNDLYYSSTINNYKYIYILQKKSIIELICFCHAKIGFSYMDCFETANVNVYPNLLSIT